MRWTTVICFAAATALSTLFAFYQMFSSFAGWDDEGYCLITVQDYSHHGGLYTHVFSQAGPFYYEFWAALFSWLPVTLDSGRMATVVVWVLTTVGFGVAVKIFTGNLVAGIATQVGACILLLSLVSQPMHPSALICLLFAVGLLGLVAIAHDHHTLGLAVIGPTVAALTLVQVNAGIFAAIALLFTGFVLAPPLRWMRRFRLVATLLFVIAPFLLVGIHSVESVWEGHSFVLQSWAARYALIVGLSAAAVAVVSSDGALQGILKRSQVRLFIVGAGALAIGVLCISLLSGTRLADFINGTFLAPTHQAAVFTIPIHVSIGVDVWGAICLAGAFWYHRLGKRASAVGGLEPIIRIAVGLGIVYCVVVSKYGEGTLSFTATLPLLFLVAIPRVETTDAERSVRVALVAWAVMESLIAYPVASTQIQWSALLSLPVGVLCAHDGFRQMLLVPSPWQRRGRGWAVIASASLASLAVLAWLGGVFSGDLSRARTLYDVNTSLRLPGSDLIHLPPSYAATLESVSRAIRQDCSTFVSYPGLNSFYFFTGESPPTSANATSWMFLFNKVQQADMVRSIESRDEHRLCVLYSAYWLSTWEEGRTIPERPLVRFVTKFEQENEADRAFFGGYLGYELFVSHPSGRPH